MSISKSSTALGNYIFHINWRVAELYVINLANQAACGNRMDVFVCIHSKPLGLASIIYCTAIDIIGLHWQVAAGSPIYISRSLVHQVNQCARACYRAATCSYRFILFTTVHHCAHLTFIRRPTECSVFIYILTTDLSQLHFKTADRTSSQPVAVYGGR